MLLVKDIKEESPKLSEMELLEVKKHIDSFQRPRTYNINRWDNLKKWAMTIWENHLNGTDWRQKVSISCKEFYLMLIDTNGRLIIRDEQLLEWENNKYTRDWLEGVIKDGRKLYLNREFKKACVYFDIALKIDPLSANALHYRACCKQALHRYREALNDYQLAIQIDPEREQVYLDRAALYSLQDLDQKAMDDLNKAIQLNRNNAEAFARRGDLHRVMEDYDAAIADLRKAIKIQPDEESHYLKWARFYQDTNEPILAYKTYRKILKMSPFNQDALFGMAMMKIKVFNDKRSAEQDLMMARSLGHPRAESVLCNLYTDISVLGVTIKE